MLASTRGYILCKLQIREELINLGTCLLSPFVAFPFVKPKAAPNMLISSSNTQTDKQTKTLGNASNDVNKPSETFIQFIQNQAKKARV